MVKRKLRERTEGRERRGGNVDNRIQAVVRDLGEDETCQSDHQVPENATYYTLLNLMM